ncbi:hypothetical protein HK102_004205 [Quaeritorhiza haematococci]|nr:hypothetical protein HK102_004205 [Quaeritorhiza haematococci]
MLEGIPTILVGIATWWILPDFPHTAKFLTEEERTLAVERLKLDNVDCEESHLSREELVGTLTDLKVWGYMLLYIGIATPLYGISFFLPTIIRNLGFSNLNAQLLSSPPYIVACLTTVILSFSSDRFRDRSLHIIITLCFSAASFLVLAFNRSTGTLYAFAILVAVGVFPAVPISLTWLANNMVGSTRGATATAMMISFGNIGGALGGQIYRTEDGPYYRFGHLVNCGFIVWAILMAIVLRIHLVRKNRQMEAMASEKSTNNFRYQL